jgi:hypothetical protein
MDHQEKESILNEIGNIRALLKTLKPVNGPMNGGPAGAGGSKRELHLF